MAFVLVQHLDPTHESALTQLLARTTAMPVQEARDGSRVEPNRVYVIPPNARIAISKRVLRLLPLDAGKNRRAIDTFFESLAEDLGALAIGIVLSGTASDGTAGIEAIKSGGGITFVQDASAEYDSMPRSAEASGWADFVLPPDKIARELTRIAKHPLLGRDQVESPDLRRVPPGSHARRAHSGKSSPPTPAPQIGLAGILALLREHFGVDFCVYKPNTITRRICRRMVLSKAVSFESYQEALAQNPGELEALYFDLLIHVTSFFRNPEVFAALEDKVFSAFLSRRPREDTIRIWVPGCSTGQEAYSVAMSLTEFCERTTAPPRIQIFATDVNEVLLEKGRHGLYAENLLKDVSPERLRRFFVQDQGGYQIRKSLREKVVFARQNLLTDPPFSRLDLISCRNLLIYLEAELQNKILPAFHYALNPGGFLLLGTSESVGAFTDLFEPVDKKLRIFARSPGATPVWRLPRNTIRTGARESHASQTIGERAKAQLPELSAQREADRVTIRQFAPPAVLVNAEFQVLQFRGSTGAYLEPPSGKVVFDLLRMAREGLMVPLRSALNEAKKKKRPASRENLNVKCDGGFRAVDLKVIPLKNLKEQCFLVFFIEPDEPATAGASHDTAPARQPPPSPGADRFLINELQSELAGTRDYLQSLQERYEAANEDLQASNEEVTSANEELQSINEELETSKEELESASEELATINEELMARNTELKQLNSDLHNLHNSLNTAVVLVARDLTIRRFTLAAEKLFILRSTDIGRPVRGVAHHLDLPDLESLLARVVDTAAAIEQEVRDQDGRWFLLRARPYVGAENSIDGAVLMLFDIDVQKNAEASARESGDFARAVIEAVPPLLVLNADLRVQIANESFFKTFSVIPAETCGRLIYELGNGQWNIPALRKLLEEVLPHDAAVTGFEVSHDFPTIGHRTLLLGARRVDSLQRLVVSFKDITDLKNTQQTLEQAKAEMAEYAAQMESFSRGLSHDVRGPLRSIKSFAAAIEEECHKCENASPQTYVGRIKTAATRLEQLLQGSLAYSMMLRKDLVLQPVELNGVLRSVFDAYPNLQLPGVDIATNVERVTVLANEAALSQIFSNLLSNAVKYVAPGVTPHIRVWAEAIHSGGAGAASPELPESHLSSSGQQRIRIWIEDNGIGIAPADRERVFDLFVRLHSDRDYAGTGVGLAIAREAVKRMGGQIGIESEPGHGSRFWIVLAGAVRSK